MAVPHQYTLETLDQIDRSIPAYAVLGDPITHSLSPAMHNAAFQKLGIPGRYVRIQVPVERLPELVEKMRTFPFLGWNCTVPHKFEMMNLCNELNSSARAGMSVNTVKNEKGKLIGSSTDGKGWVHAIREDFNKEVRDLRVLIVGIGGAGTALANQAWSEGSSKVLLLNRTFEKAQALAQKLSTNSRQGIRALAWDKSVLAKELEGIDLIVNATSIGLKPDDPSVLDSELIQSHHLVYDTIYKETALLKAAKEAGAKTANGLSMLLHQGALAFSIWNPVAPLDEVTEVMRSALQEAFKKS